MSPIDYHQHMESCRVVFVQCGTYFTGFLFNTMHFIPIPNTKTKNIYKEAILLKQFKKRWMEIKLQNIIRRPRGWGMAVVGRR